MAEAASVCLEEQGHGRVTALSVEGEFEEVFSLERLLADAQMRNSYRHAERATEQGAYGVSILAVCTLTRLTVFQQSTRRTGVDYWLLPEGSEFFQDAIRLEISGIRKGGEHTLRRRVRQKVAQTKRWEPGMPPTLVAVVEFNRPVLRIVKA